MIELIWTVFNYFKKASTPVLDCVQLFSIPLEFNHRAFILNTLLYLEASVLLEALPNSVNPKLPISVKTL